MVTVGPFSTSYSNASGSSSINESTSVTIDLSDLAGLTIGQSIRIDFIPDGPLIWTGGFGYDAGTLLIEWNARTGITVGAHSSDLLETWTLGPVEPDTGGTDPVGYSVGPDPMTLSLVVPWGTDLSAVELSLTDLSEILGTNASFSASSMEFWGSTFVTSSAVPEPGSFILVLTSFAGCLLRLQKSDRRASPPTAGVPMRMQPGFIGVPVSKG